MLHVAAKTSFPVLVCGVLVVTKQRGINSGFVNASVRVIIFQSSSITENVRSGLFQGRYKLRNIASSPILLNAPNIRKFSGCFGSFDKHPQYAGADIVN